MLTKDLQSAHPLLVALGVSALVTGASYLTAEEYAGSAVALIFGGATLFLALPKDAAQAPSHFGLALGGLFENSQLSWRRMFKESAFAFLRACALFALILPPFALSFGDYYGATESFSLSRALSAADQGSGALWPFLNIALTHLLVVALPEEAFFRGYLQTALDDRWGGRVKIFGAEVGWSLLVTSALFAVGHLATTPHPARLAVFFPSLLFGWLRARTGGIGAGVIFHAQCNILALMMARGTGLSD